MNLARSLFFAQLFKRKHAIIGKNHTEDDKMVKQFKVAVLGGGPGGYVAAIRAALGGATVALIEGGNVGGTCLNVGCIPTKTLLAGAEMLHKVRKAEEFGISVGNVSFDYAKMEQRKDAVVTKIRKSLEGLIAAHKVTIVKGYGRLISPNQIKVGDEIIEAEKIIIATGSEPRNMPAFPFDGKKVHSSTTILDLTELPKSLAIIGGGVIGAEFASLFAEFGVAVHIIEMLPTIVATEGKAVAAALTAAFQKKGIKITTDAMVESLDTSREGVVVHLKGKEPLTAEMALVAVGRKLNTENIGLDKAGVYVDERGVIPVNDMMETNVSHIYAIGDITAKWMLAHVASHQGIVAAQNAVGEMSHMHYEAVPSVVYTHPETATVGYTLEKALEKGYKAVVGKFPFVALGKSQAAIETDGFAQVIIDKDTHAILGAQVVGHEASSLVAQMALAIQNEITIEGITDTIHAHPTIAEAWLEAALIAMETPIHLPPPAKKNA
jgi:dihydrolipoamide dehydrogenase